MTSVPPAWRATGQDVAFPSALGGVCISLETLSFCMTDRPRTG